MYKLLTQDMTSHAAAKAAAIYKDPAEFNKELLKLVAEVFNK